MKELQNQFQLEIGSFQNLKGNAVVYWTVSDPEKKLNPPIQILAVNFAISIFPLDYNLVTATFPPVAFENREEFMLYIRHAQCDLISAGEFSIKKEMNNLKNLPDKEYYLLNSILDSYLTLFREKLDHLILSLSLKEKIFFLKKLVSNFRENLKIKEGNKKNEMNAKRIRKIVVDLKKHFNPFELEDFYETLLMKGKTAETLTHLYLKKMIAIHYEDYEEAQSLTSQIKKTQDKIKP